MVENFIISRRSTTDDAPVCLLRSPFQGQTSDEEDAEPGSGWSNGGRERGPVWQKSSDSGPPLTEAFAIYDVDIFAGHAEWHMRSGIRPPRG